MKTAPAKPGWYTGSIAATHPALALIELQPTSRKFAILVPARKFAAIAIRRGTRVKFCIGEFGGVTDVQPSEASRLPVRVSRANAKDRAAVHG